MQKVTELLNSIPKKLMEAINKMKAKKGALPVTTAAEPTATSGQVYSNPTSSVSSQSVTAKLPNFDKGKIKKIGLFAGIGIGVLILLSLLMRLMPKGLPILSPSPTPSATPAVVVATPIPSKYATDAGILKIEADIQVLETEMGQVELDETNLRPRPLDFNINFK